MTEEFNLGFLKLIKDEDGYGVAQPVDKDGQVVWEVVASFKYVDDFIRFICVHMPKVLDKHEQFQMAMEINNGLIQGVQQVPCEDCGDTNGE